MTKKKRAGFVTFWLWLGIIVNAISIPYALIANSSLKNLGYFGMNLIINGVDLSAFESSISNHVMLLNIVAVVSSLGLIVCYGWLLNWQRKGFWTAVGLALFALIGNVVLLGLIKDDYWMLGLKIDFDMMRMVVMTPVSILILYLILQIKKDDVSCWALLEPTMQPASAAAPNKPQVSPQPQPRPQPQPQPKPQPEAPKADEHVRHCAECGAVIPDGSQFCPKCGTKLLLPPQSPEQEEEWHAYFKQVITKNFSQFTLREGVPVTDLTGDVNDVFKLYAGRPNQVYKAEWGRPYDFVLSAEGKTKAVVMLGSGHSHNANVKYLISKMFAKKLGVPYIGFYIQFPNDEAYVVKRIKEFMNQQ